jgi:hypothetical protein
VIKILRADKDTYITDKVIDGSRQESANVGLASSLDLFKLYGMTFSGSVPNIELSRLLLHFNLDPLRDLVASQKIDLNNSSFSCKMQLFDIDGGQTCPTNYTIVVNPLSKSFDEGLGKDIVLFNDVHAANFLTASYVAGGIWNVSGASLGGEAHSSVDYISTAVISGVTASMNSSQYFVAGTENLLIDVTRAVSATLANQIPDSGFRVAYSQELEENNRTYFVKRFAGRNAYDASFHPRLLVTYDDSIQDDSTTLRLGTRGTVFLHSFENDAYANLPSGSSTVTGANSIILRLEMPISGGVTNLLFTGSQHRSGINFVNGIYSASVLIPSNNVTLNAHMQYSGSLKFIPIWQSLDSTIQFVTGSKLTVLNPDRSDKTRREFDAVVAVKGIYADMPADGKTSVRVSFFDRKSPRITASRLPIELPSSVIRDAHYQVRPTQGGNIAIPFDVVKNSTRLSSDADGMFFELDASNLVPERTYVIDVMVNTGTIMKIYKNASQQFRVSAL